MREDMVISNFILMVSGGRICKRCGRCCYMRDGGVEVKCKYLIVFEGGKTACRIYKDRNRIGRVIGILHGNLFKCLPREQLRQNFEGCPYNLPPEELIKDENK